MIGQTLVNPSGASYYKSLINLFKFRFYNSYALNAETIQIAT